MSNIIQKLMVLVITSSLATFRRCGEGFTHEGVVFPADYFDEDQLKILHGEKMLSVREMDLNDIPKEADRSLIDRAITRGELQPPGAETAALDSSDHASETVEKTGVDSKGDKDDKAPPTKTSTRAKKTSVSTAKAVE